MAATMVDVTSDPSSSSRPAWFIDELEYAGRENLDANHVARYDAKEDARGRRGRPASASRLLEGGGARSAASHDPARRRAPALGGRLRLRPLGAGGADRGVVR